MVDRIPAVLVSLASATGAPSSPPATCRVYVTDARSPAIADASLQALLLLGVRIQPKALVVAFGGSEAETKYFLKAEELGNTVHPLYCVKGNDSDEEVTVYRRCLYCGPEGGPHVMVGATFQNGIRKQPKSDLFPDELKNLHGRLLHIVTMPWPPLIDFTKDSPEGGELVTPADSLDFRMLQAISASLNFTYEMRTPKDLTWGFCRGDGNWSGTVGTLHKDEADFSMILSWLRERLGFVDYTRIYIQEPLVALTKEGLALPNYLAPARPFSGKLWLMVGISFVLFGLLLSISHRLTSDLKATFSRLPLDDALLQSWSILMQNTLPKMPGNTTHRILVGFWWMFCMLVTISYKSSLIAHLSVPSSSRTLDTIEEMVRTDGWSLGYEATYGSGWQWLVTNQNPSLKKAAQMVKVMDFEENMAAVLKGKHMFVSWKYYILLLVKGRYTDSRGYTPVHISKTEYFNYGGYGWGCRRGAPFRSSLDQGIQRLIQAGLVRYWLDELLESGAAKMRAEEKPAIDFEKSGSGDQGQGVQGLVVLGLDHLQACFYLLLMGWGVALILFLGERCWGGSLGRSLGTK